MLVSHCEMVVRKFQGKKHQLTSVNYFEIAWLYRSVQCVTVLPLRTEFPVFWEFLGIPRNSQKFPIMQMTLAN